MGTLKSTPYVSLCSWAYLIIHWRCIIFYSLFLRRLYSCLRWYWTKVCSQPALIKGGGADLNCLFFFFSSLVAVNWGLRPQFPTSGPKSPWFLYATLSSSRSNLSSLPRSLYHIYYLYFVPIASILIMDQALQPIMVWSFKSWETTAYWRAYLSGNDFHFGSPFFYSSFMSFYWS